MNECVDRLEPTLYESNITPKKIEDYIAEILGGYVDRTKRSKSYLEIWIRDIPREKYGYYPMVKLNLSMNKTIFIPKGEFVPYVRELEKRFKIAYEK